MGFLVFIYSRKKIKNKIGNCIIYKKNTELKTMKNNDMIVKGLDKWISSTKILQKIKQKTNILFM